MRYHIITVLAALLLSGTVMANPVTTSDARQKADEFLKKQATTASGSRRAALQSPQLVEAPAAFGDALHVFNIEGQNGYVIVSGDDRTEEILGYVDNGSFDINNIPANMRFWLQGYADQIKSLGNIEVQKSPRRSDRANIAPLLTTDWDQIGDYNDCLLFDEENPEWNADNLYTGCAATSMAQALYQAAQHYKSKHGNWPAVSTTVIPAYTVTQSGKTTTGHTFKALPAMVFDWEHMLDNYARKYGTPTNEEIQAVAMLMTYCGRAMHMEYGTNSSDAAFVYMPFRMAAYFGIQEHVKNMDRQYYTSQEWEDLLYNELANGRSVPYTGVSGSSTTDPGHAFVLDGYNDGLWHINWGWGQGAAVDNTTYNGYFSLSYLCPEGSGTVSGGALGSEYKYLQQATIGVSYDPVEGVANTCYTHIGGSRGYSAYSTEVTYLNYNVQGGVYTLDGAWAIDNGDGTYIVLKKDYEDRLFNRRTTDNYGEYGDLTTYTQRINQLPVNNIANGTYKVVHVSSLAGKNNWTADDGTALMYFDITVNNGSVSSVVNHPQDFNKSKLSVTKIEFIGDMDVNHDNTVRVTINNAGDDYWGMLALYYNTVDNNTLSSSMKCEHLAAIKPGETTHDFNVNITKKGEYNLWFIANGASAYASNAFGTGKMFIGYGEDANKVQAGNMQFDGQSGSTLSVKSVNGQLAEVTGTFDVTNNTGHSYSATYYANVEYGSGSSKTVYATAEIPFTVETGTHSVPFNLGVVTGLASGNTYRIRLYNKLGGNETDIATADFTLQPYFRYWLADGTVKEFAETSYYNQLSGDGLEAVAIDCRGISKSATMYMDGVTNKNCLFYIEESQKPTSSSYSTYGRNLVVDGVAENMVVNGDYLFYAPEAFTAEQISYKRTFTVGNTGNGDGWQTIMLPFSVNNVKCNGKNKRWFTSATDTRCHFWLMELTDATDEALTFDYATTFEAGKPYIIAVPGKNTEKWADSWDLTNKEMSFNGLNVIVPVTTIEPQVAGVVTFQGAYTAQNVDGYVLNAAGTKFEQQTGVEVKGYQAYITKGGSSRSLNITIAGQGTTGIGIVDNSREATTNDCYYDLQGRRVQQPANGLYIRNGKKILVK